MFSHASWTWVQLQPCNTTCTALTSMRNSSKCVTAHLVQSVHTGGSVGGCCKVTTSPDIFTYTYEEPNQIYSVLSMPERWVLDPGTFIVSRRWHSETPISLTQKTENWNGRDFCGLIFIWLECDLAPMATKALFKLVLSQNPQHLCTFHCISKAT